MSAESVCRHSCTLSCKNVIVCRPDCLQGLRLLNGCRPRCILGVFTPVVMPWVYDISPSYDFITPSACGFLGLCTQWEAKYSFSRISKIIVSNNNVKQYVFYDFISLIVVEEFWPTLVYCIGSDHWGLWTFVFAQLFEGPTAAFQSDSGLDFDWITAAAWFFSFSATLYEICCCALA